MTGAEASPPVFNPSRRSPPELSLYRGRCGALPAAGGAPATAAPARGKAFPRPDSRIDVVLAFIDG
jgi:hypothetical protein